MKAFKSWLSAVTRRKGILLIAEVELVEEAWREALKFARETMESDPNRSILLRDSYWKIRKELDS